MRDLAQETWAQYKDGFVPTGPCLGALTAIRAEPRHPEQTRACPDARVSARRYGVPSARSGTATRCHPSPIVGDRTVFAGIRLVTQADRPAPTALDDDGLAGTEFDHDGAARPDVKTGAIHGHALRRQQHRWRAAGRFGAGAGATVCPSTRHRARSRCSAVDGRTTVGRMTSESSRPWAAMNACSADGDG